LVIDYTKVTVTDCDGVDLVGTPITESLVSDHGCGSPPGFKPDQGGVIVVKPGNSLAGSHDGYSFCPDADALVKSPCTETYTQSQIIGGSYCIKTVKIAFTLTKGQGTCSGTPVRTP
jgi:hypothetical protein